MYTNIKNSIIFVLVLATVLVLKPTNMELKIDVADYLSQAEIKEMCQEQLRCEIQKFFRSESEAQRLLSNLSYEIVFAEIDKSIPNSQDVVTKKTMEILNDIKSYSVFRDAAYGGKKSLAYDLMETAVKNNVALLNEKVKDTITNKDYSSEIWDKYETLTDTFISNFYEIVRLGRGENK